MDRARTALNARIARLKLREQRIQQTEQRMLETMMELTRLRDREFEQLCQAAQRHYQELTHSGKEQTFRVRSGRFAGWRVGKPRVITDDAERLARKLWRSQTGLRYVRRQTVYTLNRRRILREWKRASRLHGVDIAQFLQFFVALGPVTKAGEPVTRSRDIRRV
ncbi:MAG: host-nuclease inhibitor Gam family protein [Candidatus Kerfeldbacteria bacterium]